LHCHIEQTGQIPRPLSIKPPHFSKQRLGLGHGQSADYQNSDVRKRRLIFYCRQDSQRIVFRQVQIQDDDTWLWLTKTRPVIGDKTKSRLSILQDGEFVWFSAFGQSPAQVLDFAMVVVNDENLSWIFGSCVH
jgi:hypothetical protein